MRRTIRRGLALAAITALGLTGPAAYADATGDHGNGPDTRTSHDHDRGSGHGFRHDVDHDYGPPTSIDPVPQRDDGPVPDASVPEISPDDNTAPAPSDSLPTGPSVDPSSPTPTDTLSDTPTPTPTRTTASPSPTKSTPSPARARLHVTVTGSQSAGTGSSPVHYAVRVRATGGEAHGVAATISVHPRGARLVKPSACQGGATLHCRLGDVHGTRELTFGGRPGHDTHRVTVGVTATAANAPATTGSLVLVLRRPPHHSRPGVTHQAPSVTAGDPGTGSAPVAAPPPAPRPAAPDVTVHSPPEAAAPQPAPVDPSLAQQRVAPPEPRLPVVAAPGKSPKPTPNGAPVTVRPVADGHGSGMPTRTIFGILAAAASFIGLVTAVALIRRRNET